MQMSRRKKQETRKGETRRPEKRKAEYGAETERVHNGVLAMYGWRSLPMPLPRVFELQPMFRRSLPLFGREVG